MPLEQQYRRERWSFICGLIAGAVLFTIWRLMPDAITALTGGY